MTGTGVGIRAARVEDAAAAAQLRRDVFPYLVMSAEQLARSIAEPTPAQREAAYVAELDGRLVGWLRAGLISWSSEPGAASLELRVHPEVRRRGIGTALLTYGDAHLDEIGARRVQAFAARESAGFGLSRGYTQNREMHYSGVDPRDLPELPATPAGVTVVPVAEVDPRLVYAADAAATLDEPGDIPVDALAYDTWVHEIWKAPMLSHDLSVAALADGVVVSFTAVETVGDRAWAGMTGTLRSHRGRGLAKLVKSVALRRAADAGIVAAYTSNDDANPAMLAVNDWLGYRRVATQLGLIRSP